MGVRQVSRLRAFARSWWLVPAFGLLGLMSARVSAQTIPDDALRERRRVLAAKPIIREVTASGQREFSEQQIKARLHSKKSSALDAIPLISARRLRRDSDRLDSLSLYNWLRAQGFLDARLRFEYAFLDSSGNTARVSVRVDEGAQTRIASADVRYPSHPPNEAIEPGVRRLEPDAPFNPFLLRQVQFDIKEVYANLGHPYATVGVDSAFSVDRRQVRLVLLCRPGPEVRFGKLNLPDLRWTKPRAVIREVTFHEGEIYRRKAILESEEWLYLSGLFDYVALEAESKGDSTDIRPDFRIRGIERKPLFVNARTGFRQDILYNVVWSTEVEGGDRNFTGRGRKLRVSALADFIVQLEGLQELKYRFAAAYTEPWPLGQRLPTTLELAFEPAVQDPLRPYQIQRWNGVITTLKRWSRKNQAWISLKMEQVDIFGLDPEAEEQFRADSGLSVTRSILVNMRRDTRNLPLGPTSGSLTFGRVEFAGGFLGGDNDFIRVEGSWSRYSRSQESVNIIAHRILVGYLQGTGNPRRVPSQELYFLGGANTVRGFQENSLGPKNAQGEAIGGQFVTVANIELRRPLFGRFWASVFADVGNLWDRIESFRWTEWNVGAGLGLQFVSPVGPLRLDYGRRIVRVDADAGGQFHISIGYAF